MLSQNQMVRKVIESTYIGKCTVIEHKKTVNANHTTSLNDEIVYKDVPCRLSFKTANPTAQSDSVNMIRTKKLNLNYLRSGHNELRYQRL